MRRLLALALAVGAMASVRGATTGSAATALALGFALMGASVTGDALRRFHLPRVTGYLLFGVVVGPSLGNLITESMSAELQVVAGIATTADRKSRYEDAPAPNPRLRRKVGRNAMNPQFTIPQARP